MSRSISYEETGRTRQKARTRAALTSAARELLAHGPTPTVEQAADAAGIARATAYRYFANQRALITATYPEVDEPSLLGASASGDPVARLDAVAAAMTRQILDHEPELRAMLRMSLEPDHGDLPFRKGRRITWIADAIEPQRSQLGRARFDRLVRAIAAVLGVEVLVWHTDVGGLSRKQAAETMRWSAAALLRAAIADR
jgi:AcrR family transcriptional regulator